MKALWFLIVAVIAILAFHLGDSYGAQDQREFETLCESPGVRCAVQLTPEYVAAHAHESLDVLPYITYQWRDDDGRLPDGTCTPGEVAVCSEGGWGGQ